MVEVYIKDAKHYKTFSTIIFSLYICNNIHYSILLIFITSYNYLSLKDKLGKDKLSIFAFAYAIFLPTSVI